MKVCRSTVNLALLEVNIRTSQVTTHPQHKWHTIIRQRHFPPLEGIAWETAEASLLQVSKLRGCDRSILVELYRGRQEQAPGSYMFNIALAKKRWCTLLLELTCSIGLA